MHVINKKYFFPEKKKQYFKKPTVQVWDEELARIAQRWADQCKPGHDHRRNTERFAVGQNVAATWSFGRQPPKKDRPEFSRHVRGWFDEVGKVQI